MRQQTKLSLDKAPGRGVWSVIWVHIAIWYYDVIFKLIYGQILSCRQCCLPIWGLPHLCVWEQYQLRFYDYITWSTFNSWGPQITLTLLLDWHQDNAAISNNPPDNYLSYSQSTICWTSWIALTLTHVLELYILALHVHLLASPGALIAFPTYYRSSSTQSLLQITVVLKNNIIIKAFLPLL